MAYGSKILKEVEDYLDGMPEKHAEKATEFMRLLEDSDGYLDEPYAKHLRKGIRELIVNFNRTKHRILYTLISNKRVLYLTAFQKKTQKTPPSIIVRAELIKTMYLAMEKKKSKKQ